MLGRAPLPLHVTYRRLIIDLADNARLPTVFPYREQFEIGAGNSPGRTPFRGNPRDGDNSN